MPTDPLSRIARKFLQGGPRAFEREGGAFDPPKAYIFTHAITEIPAEHAGKMNRMKTHRMGDISRGDAFREAFMQLFFGLLEPKRRSPEKSRRLPPANLRDHFKPDALHD